MSASTAREAGARSGSAVQRRGPGSAPRAGGSRLHLRRAPWRVLVGRVVVNGLAVALVVAVLPGVVVSVRHRVLAYLVLGAVLGLVNAFVKPAIQFVALPLLLGSMGLVVLAVDVGVFWVLDLVTPYLSTTGALPLVAAGLVLGLVSYLLENLLGLAPPIVSDRPERRGPP